MKILKLKNNTMAYFLCAFVIVLVITKINNERPFDEEVIREGRSKIPYEYFGDDYTYEETLYKYDSRKWVDDLIASL